MNAQRKKPKLAHAVSKTRQPAGPRNPKKVILGLAALAVGHAALANLETVQPKSNTEKPPVNVPVRNFGAATLKEVEVKSFSINGNTVVPLEVLEQKLANVRGRMTVQELQTAVIVLQQYYRSLGYGGVVAYVPEKFDDSGVIRVEILEGKIERIQVKGNKLFDTAIFESAVLGLTPGLIPRLDETDRQVLMLNENPARKVAALLQPGSQRGGILATLEVSEGPVLRGQAHIENTGSGATGRWLAGVGLQHANVWGRDHVFAADLQTALQNPSRLTSISANYRIPVPELLTFIDGYLAYSKVSTGKVDTIAGGLDYKGANQIVGLRLQHLLPRLGEFDQRIGLELEQRRWDNDCSIEGLPDGACGSAGQSLGAYPIALSYQTQWAQSNGIRMSAKASLHGNLKLGTSNGDDQAFNQSREGAGSNYGIARLDARIQVPLDSQLLAVGRFNAQWADGPLISGEQFGLGGNQTVRGYKERELSGDHGISLGVELMRPLNLDEPPELLKDLKHTAFAFAEAGWVKNSSGRKPCDGARSECSLAALGVGLRTTGDKWQLQLEAGYALASTTATPAGQWKAHVRWAIQF